VPPPPNPLETPLPERPHWAPTSDPLSWIQIAVQVTAVVVAGLAGFTLAAWAWCGQALLTINPVLALMRANTALGLLLAAVALLVLSPREPHPRAVSFARYAAGGTGLVAAVGLLGHLLGTETGFDRLLAWGPMLAGPPRTFRMGTNTAIAFFGLSGALLLTRRAGRPVQFAQGCALGATVVALFTFLGYAYGIIEVRRWFSGGSMSPQTTVSILLMGLAIICCEPERGLVAPLLRRGASGFTVRRLLPAVFLALLALGAISVAVQEAALFDAEVVVAGFALASFLLIAALVYWNAAALSRVERLRAGAEAERREVNARLVASEERFRLASKALRGWIYDGDVATGRVTRSEGFYTTLGYDPETAPETRDWWYSLLHPEDAPLRAPLAQQAYAGTQATLTQEYRIRARDGRYLWVWDHAVIVRDAAGRPVRVVGNVIDVTARKTAEAAVRESEERFRNMADHSPGMVWLSDRDGAFTFLSESWYTLTGQTPETALGLGWLDAVYPEEREVTRGILLAAASRRIPYRFDFRVLDREDGVRWVFLAATPRFDAGREFLGYVGSMIDITDRKSMEEELREADQRKDEFLAMLGHELRNPLAPIRSAAAVMRYMAVDDPKFTWVREVIERQVAHMTRLIDDLLDVARITRGTVQLREERIELARLVREAVELSRPLIEDRGHELRVELPAERVWLEADPARLAQVLANLLNNAAKYTEQGGRIDLVAALIGSGSEIEIRIADTGVGIDPELLPRIFDLFTQDKQSIDRSQGGLGIGLTLVKALVELHGGLVEARSPGRGRGAEFVVRLPLASPDAPSVPLPPAEHPLPSAVPRRVLVVDDNRDSADGLATLLSIQGHHVATAHDGPSALEQAHRFLPDIVLLDIGLPGMDGYEVARRMRAAPDLQASRLIAVTGYGGESDRLRSSEAGFSNHLVKPVDAEALHGLLNSLEAA
jgi:PAS domain S-box-containing protein